MSKSLHAAPATVLALMLLLVAGCSTSTDAPTTNQTSPSSSTSANSTASDVSVSPEDTENLAAAETTLRAFFDVKAVAGESFSAHIDKQARYLTSRDVHPSAAYEAELSQQPNTITAESVQLELSGARLTTPQTVTINFAATTQGTSYGIVGDEMQLTGSPVTSTWTGTATLKNTDGQWLINALTTESLTGETR